MTRAILLLALALTLGGCADRGEDSAPGPAPSGEPPTPAEQAQAIASEPRMLLFDLETALQAVHDAGGAYPTTVEFQLEERWELQRAALDAAFTSWEYASDGTSYRLTGELAGRRLQIASPPS